MPLPPMPSAPDLARARQLRDRAVDMERHMDQQVPRLIQGADGWLYLAAAGLEADQVDIEPYPVQTPQSRAEDPPAKLAAPAMLAEADSRVQRLDARLSDYGHLAVIPVQGGPTSFNDIHDVRILLRGNQVAIRPVIPFQPVAIRRGRFYIAPGTIGGQKFVGWPGDLAGQQLSAFAGKHLSLDNGYLAVRIDWLKSPTGSFWTYSFQGAESVTTTPTLHSNPPPGTSPVAGDDTHNAQVDGWFWWPLALVRDGAIVARWWTRRILNAPVTTRFEMHPGHPYPFV